MIDVGEYIYYEVIDIVGFRGITHPFLFRIKPITCFLVRHHLCVLIKMDCNEGG